MKRFHFALTPAFSVVLGLTTGANTMARGTDSGAPALLVHAADLNTTYEAVLNEVKKEGLSVDSASKDAGIKTAISVSGRYHQTGEHIEIQFIQDSSKGTTVRVTAVRQTRYNALNTEPWSSPKVDPKQSQDAADKIKAGLGW
jgi:hypothetical protein